MIHLSGEVSGTRELSHNKEAGLSERKTNRAESGGGVANTGVGRDRHAGLRGGACAHGPAPGVV